MTSSGPSTYGCCAKPGVAAASTSDKTIQITSRRTMILPLLFFGVDSMDSRDPKYGSAIRGAADSCVSRGSLDCNAAGVTTESLGSRETTPHLPLRHREPRRGV